MTDANDSGRFTYLDGRLVEQEKAVSIIHGDMQRVLKTIEGNGRAGLVQTMQSVEKTLIGFGSRLDGLEKVNRDRDEVFRDMRKTAITSIIQWIMAGGGLVAIAEMILKAKGGG